MFIVSLTYIKPLSEVDKYIEAHVVYLKEQYKNANFIASGRKVPRSGGIILSKLNSKLELEKVLQQDPFYIANIATYEITEFIPSMTTKEFENLKEEFLKNMTLQLENVVITGRTFEEYSSFFDLKIEDLKGKKVLDCPSGASSFVSTLKQNNIDVTGVDLLYEFDKDSIEAQGYKTIEKIYQDTSWMDVYKMDFYKTKENHRNHRETALKTFVQDYNSTNYIFAKLPNLPFENKDFDIALSSHLLFVYDNMLDYEFHKNSILEMLRVSKEVRIFPLVDFKNTRVDEEKNFSPFLYQILDELLKDFKYEIVRVDFEFQPRANFYLRILQ